MYAIIAAIPILSVIILMIIFNWSAKRAIPIAWALAALIAFFVWKMGFKNVTAYTVSGFFNALETLLILVGAVLIMNVMKHSGAMYAINRMFHGITKDARIQVLIVGFGFAGFLEGAAGLGTPAALAAPLLISVGFPPLAAVTITLIYNSTSVGFGAVGTPIFTVSSLVKDAVEALGGNIDVWAVDLTRFDAVGHAFGAAVIIYVGVCVLVKLFGKNRSFKDALPALPFCLFFALVFDFIYVFVAYVFGPEMPTIAASILTMFISMYAAKKGFMMPKEVWTFEPEADWDDEWRATAEVPAIKTSDMPLLKAWLPYILICIWLAISRMNLFGLKTWGNSIAIGINNIMGVEGLNWSFKPFWNVGVTPFLFVAILSIFIHKMDAPSVKSAFIESVKQIKGAAIALFFGVAMVNLYRYTNVNSSGMSSMLVEMASGIAAIAGKGGFVVLSPVIGVLGAFISGSCTVSCIMFSAVQFETATVLGLPQVIILALQIQGACIGNMICANNVIAACATSGIIGREGKVLRTNLLPCLIYCTVVIIVMGAAIMLGLDPHTLG